MLHIWLADVDCLLPQPLGSDRNERPQVNLPVSQRTFRAARMPNPFEPYATLLRDIANQIDYQPGRRTVICPVLKWRNVLPADTVNAIINMGQKAVQREVAC